MGIDIKIRTKSGEVKIRTAAEQEREARSSMPTLSEAWQETNAHAKSIVNSILSGNL